MKKAMTPYNFIPFPKKAIYRYEGKENLPNQSNISKYDKPNEEDIYTGVINYKVTSQDLIFINDGNGEFMKIDNKYAIPGSTIKGLIRKNAAILSQSMPKFIEDKNLWYRGLADKSKKLRDQYDNDLKDKSLNSDNRLEDGVSAGYIIKRNNKYFLYEAESYRFNHSYMKIKESKLKTLSFANEKTDKYFMYTDDINWEELDRLKKREEIGKINRILKQNKNRSFSPYQVKVFYKMSSNKKYIEDISLNEKPGFSQGYLVNSSNLGNKKVHYLVFSKTDKYHRVNQNVIEDFKINIEYRQHKESKIFNLNYDNEKVVFYKTKDGFVDVIGFTPYLKIPYRNSISSGIKTEFCNDEQNKNKFDYVDSIFGMTSPVSYRSRVVFDNLLAGEEYNSSYLGKPVNKILSNPSPKSFQLYLKQDDSNYLINYNDDFELRGYKFYYLKNNVDISEDTNRNLTTELKPLKKDVVFEGRVHFKNLYKDELGLLLMALKPFKKGIELIGQGKPYGFGKVKIQIDNVELIDEENLYSQIINQVGYNEEKIKKTYYNNTQILSNDKIRKYVNYFEKEFEKRVRIQTKDNSYRMFALDNEIINSFYYSKTEERDINQTKYMELREFRNRNKLVSVSEITEKKTKKLKKIENELKLSLTAFEKGKDLTIDERVKQYKNILVCSKTSIAHENLKPIFKGFKSVFYKTIKEVESYNKYDIVIFNNFGGEEEEEQIESKMDNRVNAGFVFFNDQRQRININRKDLIMNFSNSKVTLYDSIIQVARALESFSSEVIYE